MSAFPIPLHSRLDELDVHDMPLGRVEVADDDYTATVTDRYVALTTPLTADRTVTLPLASSVDAATEVRIVDESGTAGTFTAFLVDASETEETYDFASDPGLTVEKLTDVVGGGSATATVTGGAVVFAAPNGNIRVALQIDDPVVTTNAEVRSRWTSDDPGDIDPGHYHRLQDPGGDDEVAITVSRISFLGADWIWDARVEGKGVHNAEAGSGLGGYFSMAAVDFGEAGGLAGEYPLNMKSRMDGTVLRLAVWLDAEDEPEYDSMPPGSGDRTWTVDLAGLAGSFPFPQSAGEHGTYAGGVSTSEDLKLTDLTVSHNGQVVDSDGQPAAITSPYGALLVASNGTDRWTLIGISEGRKKSAETVYATDSGTSGKAVRLSVGDLDPLDLTPPIFPVDDEFFWDIDAGQLKQWDELTNDWVVRLDFTGSLNATEVIFTNDTLTNVAAAFNALLGTNVDADDPDLLHRTIYVEGDPNTVLLGETYEPGERAVDEVTGETWQWFDDDPEFPGTPPFQVAAENILGTILDANLPTDIVRDDEVAALIAAEVANQLEDIALTAEQIAAIETLNDFLADNPDLEAALDAKIDEAAFTGENQVLVRTFGTIFGTPFATLAATTAFSDLYAARKYTITAITNNNRTLVAGDLDNVLLAMTDSSNERNVTIPTDASLTAAVGSTFSAVQRGTEPFTVVAASPGTTTIVAYEDRLTSAGPGARMLGTKLAANLWLVEGNAVP